MMSLGFRLSPSGSSEGVIASTPEKWTYLPLDNKVIRPNSRITLFCKLATADGIDYSDCGIVIPYQKLNGSAGTLNNGTFTGADLVAATSVNVWHELAHFDTVEPMRLGGGKLFISVENDA